jgi:hypothetical protein
MILVSIILYDESHFRGISLALKNSQGNYLIFDGMYQPSIRVQVISLDDPISKYATGCKLLESWYVKVGTSSDASGMASFTIPLTTHVK